MRRILVCLLVLAVLAGCMAVSAAEDTETVMDQILDRLGEITDQTRGMSDVELAEEIQAMAGVFRDAGIPVINGTHGSPRLENCTRI